MRSSEYGYLQQVLGDIKLETPLPLSQENDHVAALSIEMTRQVRVLAGGVSADKGESRELTGNARTVVKVRMQALDGGSKCLAS